MNPHQLLDTALNSDPIDALTAIRELQHQLQEQQLHQVLTLRRHGATWGFIGRTLGVSRQAALQRFGQWEAPTQR